MKKATNVFGMSFVALAILGLISIFTFGQTALAAANCKHSRTRLNCVEFVDNYDGDSITFNVSKVHPLIGDHVKIRIFGVNTAEMRSSDACERDVAYRAQALVEKELTKAKRIDLVDVGRGKYFRVLAEVIFDKKSLSQMLLQRRLAVRYDGGTKPIVDWCSI